MCGRTPPLCSEHKSDPAVGSSQPRWSQPAASGVADSSRVCAPPRPHAGRGPNRALGPFCVCVLDLCVCVNVCVRARVRVRGLAGHCIQQGSSLWFSPKRTTMRTSSRGRSLYCAGILHNPSQDVHQRLLANTQGGIMRELAVAGNEELQNVWQGGRAHDTMLRQGTYS